MSRVGSPGTSLEHEIERLLKGETRTVARFLSRVENDPGPETRRLLQRLHGHSGGIWTIGITGSPGVGKSTLVDRSATVFRARKRAVAILAVDPSSPFSGGAVLGDRVRMQRLSRDSGVFIRSLASRGKLGGLSMAVRDSLVVLGAAGFDIGIVETVGVGQGEIDVHRAADVTVVVLAPGLGDDVQIAKAGLMEIADIFVVNKCDLEGSGRLRAELEATVAETERADGWIPPVIATTATKGDGAEALVDALERFQSSAAGPGREGRELRMIRKRLIEMFRDGLTERIMTGIAPAEWDRLSREVKSGESDPYSIVESLLERVGPEGFKE